MLIELLYSKKEDVPASVLDLYTEKEGKFILTGVRGMKTQSDVDTLMTAKTAEVEAHKATKAKLALWGDKDATVILAELDKIEEYKLAAEGNIDDEKINQIVESRLKSHLGPIERERDNLTKENATLTEENGNLVAQKLKRTIHDDIREAAGPSKVIDTAMSDVLMLGESVFEVNEAGKSVTKDNVGVTPGIEADIWLQEMAEKRPHWWPASQGGGGGGGNPPSGLTNNPWSRDNFNRTQQAIYAKANGTEKAEQAAKAAGTTLTGPMPEK